jgi:hypothetical protein
MWPLSMKSTVLRLTLLCNESQVKLLLKKFPKTMKKLPPTQELRCENDSDDDNNNTMSDKHCYAPS